MSDSEDDRSMSFTSCTTEEEDDEDEFAELENNKSLYFMAFEQKRRLSTIPVGAAGASK